MGAPDVDSDGSDDDMPPLQPVESLRPKAEEPTPTRTLYKTYENRAQLMNDVWCVFACACGGLNLMRELGRCRCWAARWMPMAFT